MGQVGKSRIASGDAMKSNALRMSFGEWIFRMAETNLPHPARLLAIYAAALHIRGNSELGFLCGIESEKTLAKWKAHVLKSGWVTIEGRSGGRGHGISIGPAYKETPVSFTDVLQRNPGKFYPGNCRETPVEITPVNAENPGNGDGGLGETPVEITPVSAETPVTATGVSAPASRACIETPSELLISKSYNNKIQPNLANHLDPAREAAALQKLDDLEKKLLSACNGALDNPVNCQGLLNLSTPIMWLNQGCDLDADVLPTLRAVGKVRHGRRIRSWDYFTSAVQQARDKRIAGLPAIPSGPATKIQLNGLSAEQREKVLASIGKAKGGAHA